MAIHFALRVTSADVDERAEGAARTAEVQAVTGWRRRFRRLAKGYERLPTTRAELQFLAFARLLRARVVKRFAPGS